MKDFNIKKYLLDNPLTNNNKKGKLDEAFDGMGGVFTLKPVNEAPIKPRNIYADEPDTMDIKQPINKWMNDIESIQPEYKDWKASWEYPGIIVWSHADIIDAIVVATPGWDGPGTPVEFQSAKGSTQMLKVLDQDEFPNIKAYIAAIAPYLDMVADANEVEQEDEGYMGTDYDSSEDMAVDMVKKGITRENRSGINTPRVDYLNPIEDTDDEDFTNDDRIMGLGGDQLLKSAQFLIADGFDLVDIINFLKANLK